MNSQIKKEEQENCKFWFASLKLKANVTFEMIRSQCTTITEDWKKAYKESCQVVHASPLGTLGRMGSPNENRVISTGSSDYGLAPPAVNSAISLMHVTLFYFGLLRQMDSRAMIRTIQKWLDMEMDMGKLAVWRLATHSTFGGTWLSDYVPNRLGGFVQVQETKAEPEQIKPDCPLIETDGNIFHLMGKASETLRKNGMQEQAEEMRNRIIQCQSYDSALSIIGDYVNITSAHQEVCMDMGME